MRFIFYAILKKSKGSLKVKPVIVQILRAPIGGIRKHVFDIIEFLEDSEYDQVLITNINHSDRPIPKIKNLIVCHMPIIDKPGFRDILLFVKIILYLHRSKFNSIKVIHGHGAKGGIFARALAFFIKAKIVYTPHGGSLHRVYGVVKNKAYDLVEMILSSMTDVFLFESHYSADTFYQNIKNVKNKAVVNYNGVEIPQNNRSTVYKSQCMINMASFGLLRHLKGHDIAIETCALLHRANIPFTYTIYGVGEFKSKLEELIMKHDLAQKVMIKEYCEDVLSEMIKFDFIFHPSRFESFGYVPVEAMSLKIPVIGSKEGGLKEVVLEGGHLVASNNTPDEYFQILMALYHNSSSLELTVEKAFDKVCSTFSKQIMLEKIYNIYRR